MHKLKTVKIYLCFAVLLFVAKPFLGFSMFNRVHPPAAESIFIKAFTKRKQEYVEGSSFDILTIQKKLANPFKQLFLRFSFLLSIIFPFSFVFWENVTNRFSRCVKSISYPRQDAWLLNGQLII
jgi:hypothetical protein